MMNCNIHDVASLERVFRPHLALPWGTRHLISPDLAVKDTTILLILCLEQRSPPRRMGHCLIACTGCISKNVWNSPLVRYNVHELISQPA